MKASLAGRRAYVTGGSSGIGAGIVQALAQAGARVAIGASQHAKEAAASALQLPPPCCHYRPVGNHFVVQADLSKPEDIDRAVGEVIGTMGGLDIFVHSAGFDITQPRPTHETDQDLWDRMLSVHLSAAFRLSRLLIPHLLLGKNPSILFVGSVCGLVAWQGDVAYNVAKAGLHQLARCIATDYARHGLRANAIAPGIIDTPLVRSFASAMEGGQEAGMRMLADMHPLGRYAEVSEVAAAAAFLCSDQASFITGTILPIDGGFTAV